MIIKITGNDTNLLSFFTAPICSKAWSPLPSRSRERTSRLRIHRSRNKRAPNDWASRDIVFIGLAIGLLWTSIWVDKMQRPRIYREKKEVELFGDLVIQKSFGACVWYKEKCLTQYLIIIWGFFGMPQNLDQKWGKCVSILNCCQFFLWFSFFKKNFCSMYTPPYFWTNIGWKKWVLYTRLYSNLQFKRDQENKIIVKITGYMVKSS